MAVQFVLESTGASLFHSIDVLRRIPEADDHVYLYAVGYKVERVETYLEDDAVTNPLSGQVAPWGLSKQLYKVHLSVLP